LLASRIQPFQSLIARFASVIIDPNALGFASEHLYRAKMAARPAIGASNELSETHTVYIQLFQPDTIPTGKFVHNGLLFESSISVNLKGFIILYKLIPIKPAFHEAILTEFLVISKLNLFSDFIVTSGPELTRPIQYTHNHFGILRVRNE
jgi:hypothetical protein